MSWFHLRKQKNFNIKAEWERPELCFVIGVVHSLNKMIHSPLTKVTTAIWSSQKINVSHPASVFFLMKC